MFLLFSPAGDFTLKLTMHYSLDNAQSSDCNGPRGVENSREK